MSHAAIIDCDPGHDDVSAILVATLFVGMPWGMAFASFGYGAVYGLLPIGWIVFNAMFLYQIAVDTGKFEIMKASIARLTSDRRLQVLLIAFAFGAIMEGAAGFGAPVAISAALMVGLGFRPFPAAVLCLIANTAPVAWGSIGRGRTASGPPPSVRHVLDRAGTARDTLHTRRRIVPVLTATAVLRGRLPTRGTPGSPAPRGGSLRGSPPSPCVPPALREPVGPSA